ncbi:aminoglycoside phosphotransferase [Jannaschia pagri]|uniref:Aminoglycoside phosphotransferase n=1 Tax=Jannaschia pagri TaxID=2829797 RepID=A0ABQ4NQM6_9RHOB|nr:MULTISPECIES: phosphotransferase [unclassified Jannaschia]GIT92555.1 aminoglycoside phosphotransferase [Jannaschia sp. AI_61]GIT96585.1 aminoglycoside phosphotransferase [Jannaschia sp. AI_62]
MTSNRAATIARFLATTDWAGSQQIALAGDASLRRYIRLAKGADRAMLMDAPPETGEDTRPFLRMAQALRDMGLSTPKIIAENVTDGFVLMEDFGDAIYTTVCAQNPEQEPHLYAAAGAVLAQMQTAPAPDLPAYGPLMPDLAALALDWYAPEARDARDDLTTAMAQVLADTATGPAVLTHRDFHADNLMWLPARSGLARVGLLDFQDAMLGPPEYDLASLIHDPRRPVSADAAKAATQAYITGTGRPIEEVTRGVAVASAQRNLRILGVFARLCLRDGKTHYPDFIPRTWDALTADLRHSALSNLRSVVDAVLPPPTDARLQAIRDRAGQLRGQPHGATP